MCFHADAIQTLKERRVCIALNFKVEIHGSRNQVAEPGLAPLTISLSDSIAELVFLISTTLGSD